MNFPFLHRFLFSQEFMIVFLFHLLSVLYSYYEFNPSCVNPLSVCPNIKRSITFIFPRKSFLEHCGSAPVQSGWLLCLLPSYYPVISFHHQPRSFHLFFWGGRVWCLAVHAFLFLGLLPYFWWNTSPVPSWESVLRRYFKNISLYIQK